MIRVRLLFFASLRDLAGANEAALELPAGATIETAWSETVRRWPALAPRRASLAFALNERLARPDARLAEGDVLALLPPVSGG